MKLIAANQNDILERCYFILKQICELCFCLFSLMYSRAYVIHMVKNIVLLMGGLPKSRNFREFGHFFLCFVIRKFFNARTWKLYNSYISYMP